MDLWAPSSEGRLGELRLRSWRLAEAGPRREWLNWRGRIPVGGAPANSLRTRWLLWVLAFLVIFPASGVVRVVQGVGVLLFTFFVCYLHGEKMRGGLYITQAFSEPFCNWFSFEAFTFIKCLILKFSLLIILRVKKLEFPGSIHLISSTVNNLFNRTVLQDLFFSPISFLLYRIQVESYWKILHFQQWRSSLLSPKTLQSGSGSTRSQMKEPFLPWCQGQLRTSSWASGQLGNRWSPCAC